MRFIKRFFRHNFFIRLASWEYWPFGIVQFPFFIYWLWLSLKARSLLFFSASNPSIVLGGMFGESKYDLIKRLSPDLIPVTLLVQVPTQPANVMSQILDAGLSLPVIFKPDIGERGFMVRRIFSLQDIEKYLTEIRGNFLIQELIDLPVECGVFFIRYPGRPEGQVTSLVLKEMLSVTGNGVDTVQELINTKPRAKLQAERLREMYEKELHQVLKTGEQFELNPIGNHCLGTKFLDGNHYITDEMSASFTRIANQIDHFYFGRFDLKCESVEALRRGNVKILEINGCGAEPAHIYQPGFPLMKALNVLREHWQTLYNISMQNKKAGFAFTPLREGMKIYKNFRQCMRPQ